MTQTPQSFKAAEIAKTFKDACTRFDKLLAADNSGKSKEISVRFHEDLKEHKQQGALSIAFIGQYSSGKSTIISALTGRRDIHIDADIATDKTSTYDWNGIKVIDTPGLFTDRQDHDAISYDAIAKSDLLVFCLTHMLFDSLTVENFKKLAYEKSYRWKMMLVINKMSSEAGEEEQKISSYRHSLAEALKPYNLGEFLISFIDAKDYCEGVDTKDDFGIEISNFDTFISGLNHFVEHRGSLTKFDTPIRIALKHLDDAQIHFTRSSGGDTVFLEILNNLYRRVNKDRERLRIKVKGITLNMFTAISKEGNILARSVGDSNIEGVNRQSEINIRQHYESAGIALEEAVGKAGELINLEIETVLKDELTQTFIAQLNFDSTVSVKNPKAQANADQIKNQINKLKGIGEDVGYQLLKSSTRGIANTAGSGFLRHVDVAGSGLHKAVYTVGKAIGFKFKPFQAIGIAKNIGNAARFLGPTIAVVSVVAELHAAHQEQQREQQMADIRRGITSQFQTIAQDLTKQIEDQLREAEEQIYGQIEWKITEARKQNATEVANSQTETSQLAEIRRSLEGILQEVQAVARG